MKTLYSLDTIFIAIICLFIFFLGSLVDLAYAKALISDWGYSEIHVTGINYMKKCPTHGYAFTAVKFGHSLSGSFCLDTNTIRLN